MSAQQLELSRQRKRNWARALLAKNPEEARRRYRVAAARYRAKYPEKIKAASNARVRRFRGIPEATRPCPAFCEMGCGRQATKRDHPHGTDIFRGWLCQHCNWGLGHFLDSPALLRAAADYLELKR